MSRGYDDIRKDVKERTFLPVYLIYGEEAYIRENCRKMLIKALVTPGDTLNYAHFAGKGVDPKEIVSLAVTLPFMAEKRVILVSESGLFKASDDDIIDYIKNPSPDTVLIFVEADVDTRGRGYRAIKEAGYDVEVKGYDHAKLITWIAADFKRYGKVIGREAAEQMIERAGEDMNALDIEVCKLSAYTGDRNAVSEEDVRRLVHRNPASNIFHMMDAIGSRELNKAMGIYYDMLDEKTNPMGILSSIERHFRYMIAVQEMKEKGFTDAEIADGLSIRPFTVPKYYRQAGKFSKTRMLAVIDSCVDANRGILTGRIDKNLAVEMVMVGAASA